MATDLEPHHGRYMWPLIDSPNAKVVVELHLTARNDLARLGTGKLISEILLPDDMVTTIWRQERAISSYLIAFIVGPLRVVDKWTTAGGVPAAVYGPVNVSAESIKRTFQASRKICDWMTTKLGPLPSVKFYQVQVDLSSALENESLIGIPSSYVIWEDVDWQEEGYNATRVIVHELAHSYFGNAVVLSDFSHLWLKESFATLLPHVYAYAATPQCPEEGDLLFLHDFMRYISMGGASLPAPLNKNFTHPGQLYTQAAYTGATLRLYVLMQEMGGSDRFWEGVQMWLKEYAGKQPADSHDFRRIMERASCQSLERFFDSWIFQGGHPILRICVQPDKRVMTVEQTQKRPMLFSLPIAIGQETYFARFTKPGQRIVSIDIAAVVAGGEFLLDPEDSRGLLFELDAEKSSIPAAWVHATLGSKTAHMMAKYHMALLVQQEDAMIAIYENEPRYSVRAALLAAFSSDLLLEHILESEEVLSVRARAVPLCNSKHREVLLKHLDSFGRKTRGRAIDVIGRAKNPDDLSLFRRETVAQSQALAALGRAGQDEYLCRLPWDTPGLERALQWCAGKPAAEKLKEILSESVAVKGRVSLGLLRALISKDMLLELEPLYPKFISEEDWVETKLESRISPKHLGALPTSRTGRTGARPDWFSLAIGVIFGVALLGILQKR